MNKIETKQLLDEISAVDKRQITPETVQMWSQILGHIPLDIARQAHIMARKDASVTYLEPKHIVAWAREAAYALDRSKPKGPEPVLRGDPEPLCREHSIKITNCKPCCRKLSVMSEEPAAKILVYAKEHILA